MAGKPGTFTNSDVAVCTYTINVPPGTTEGVVFNPLGGTYPNTQAVGMSSPNAGSSRVSRIGPVSRPNSSSSGVWMRSSRC